MQGTIPLFLVFNPSSGPPGDEGGLILKILSLLQAHHFNTEVFLLQPGCDLNTAIFNALQAGVTHFAACGGDGTVDSVAELLASEQTGQKSRPKLAIFPAGTQNNIARSLKIPSDPRLALELILSGHTTTVDMARVTTPQGERVFLEACSIGLLSALFPAADDIQHGNYPRLAEFLGTLVTFPLSTISLQADDLPEISGKSHVILVSNTPFVGPKFIIPSSSPINDGFLDVLAFNDLTQMDLAAYAVLASGALPENDRIRHFHARKISVTADPAMPVLADGFHLGATPVTIESIPRAIEIFTPKS